MHACVQVEIHACRRTCMHAGGHPCTLGVQAVTPGHWPAVRTHLTDEEAEGQTQTPAGRWAASEAGADTAGPPQAAAPGQPGSPMLTSLPPGLVPRSPSPPPQWRHRAGSTCSVSFYSERTPAFPLPPPPIPHETHMCISDSDNSVS